MIIPFPPGGTLDVVGRMLAQKLTEQMGQSFIVDNRPGAGGTIGASAVAKARPDGYTLLFSPSTFVSTPMTMPTPPYDAVKDFTPVALVAKAPLAIAIRQDLPFNDVKGLIAYAKANPGNVTFAIGSSASAGHMSTELLKRAARHRLPDRALQGFRARVPGPDRRPHRRVHRSDSRLGVACEGRQASRSSRSRRRSACRALPERAHRRRNHSRLTSSTAGTACGARRRCRKEIADRLNAEVNKALAGDMKAKLTEQGLLLTPGSIDDFVRFQQDDTVKVAKIIKEANIRAE